MKYLIPGIVLAILLTLFFKFAIRRITILEYEKGLMYVKGQFSKILEAGQYWYSPLFVIIQKLDCRSRYTSISGQEVLSADSVTLKVSLAANYQIIDPVAATHNVQNFQDALYLELQLALREIIGAADIDAILKNRNEFSSKLLEIVAPKAEDMGLKLISVNLKDIMFPGKLKEVFAQVVSARQEGLAMLEKARGEMAALRNLANAAKMIESNPALLQLRLVQTLNQSSGNTLMMGMPASPLSVITPNTTHGRTSVEKSSEPSA